MEIAGYIKTSLLEWPGKVSAVVFTPGCNLRCPFCHNSALVQKGNTLEEEFYRQITEEDVWIDLKKRKRWVDAVVVSGGEPTLQSDLSSFFDKAKSMGFLAMLHTNGTNPKVIADLLSKLLVDYICMDLKGDFENYSYYSGCPDNQIIAIKESVKLIAQNKVEYEFRTTVVPGLHNLENLTVLARQLGQIFESCKATIGDCHWYLQQFQPKNTLDKKYLKIKPYSREELEIFQKRLQIIVPNVFLRGV